MMKRTLSLLLCLVMVLSFAAPAVQASGTDDIYVSEGNLDDIIVGDNVILDNVVIDDNSVSTTEPTLQSPTDLVTDSTEQATSPVLAETETTPVDEGCKCVDLASAVDHSGVCLVKVPYMEACEASAEELFAQWATYTADEQAFMLGYLEEYFPLKHIELQKLLSAPTGSASETYVDGTTVSVEGIPQDGSLTVGEAADEVKDIVDAYVAENAEKGTELFSYDVSVQDGEGADWQPDTSVKMELELPGEKLHKYTKVYVVHVDDNGVATTIEATVTEDGKIAFETPGFSAFYGFTVDFDYEGVQFSIPGMSSIKLSELFEQLQMPLNAADVVNVEYTDYTQLKIEQLEGDWLLTSLKAFTTEEKLTLTMADGSVYQIKVTDAEVLAGTYAWHIYNGYYGSTNHIYCSSRFPQGDGYAAGTGPNSIFNKSFTSATRPNGTTYYWDSDDDVAFATLWFDDANQVTTVNLKPVTSAKTLVIDMVYEFAIRNGANVTIQVDPSYSGVTEEIIIRSANPAKPLFSVVNSSLTIKGSENTKIILEFGANSDGTPANTNQGNKYPIIWENGKDDGTSTARSLNLENVTFRHSAYGAVDMYYSQMTSVTLKDCTFESTVDNISHGGAIRHRDSARLAMTKFEATGCTFDGNTASARGGAIALQKGVETFTIQDCQFSDCTATTHGGAISLQGAVGNISITGTKGTDADGNTTYTTSFTNCTSGSRGGAVGANCSSFGNITVTDILVSGNTAGTLGGGLHFGNTDATASITGGAVSVSGCDFKDNMAHGVGGGLCVTDGQYDSVSVTNCTFDNCDTTGYGGAIGFKAASDSSAVKFSVKEDISIIGCAFTNCLAGCLTPAAYQTGTTDVPTTWDHDGDPSTPEIDHINGASGAGAIIIGGAIGGKVEIKGADADHPTKFENCLTWNNAGAIFFTNDLNVKGVTNSETNKLEEAVTLQYLNFDKCFARDAGAAVYFSSGVIPKFDMSNCLVQYCGYFDAEDPKFDDPDPAVKDAASLIEITKEWFSVPKTNTALADTWLTYDKEDFYPGTDYSGTFRTVGNTACVAQITDCEFNYNRSYAHGGGIYWNANRVAYDSETGTTPIVTPSLTITNTKFDHNSAITDGGAIFCEGSVTLESCELSYNTADRLGGAIAQNVYNNSGRQLGESGAQESTSLILKAATGGEPVKIHNNSALNGGGISISVGLTNSYPHTVKDGVADTDKNKPANWIFDTDFTYEVNFQLGGSHVYENYATQNGGGIYYATAYYLGNTEDPEDGVSWTERQRQVDSFVKDIKIDDGLIYSNIAGYAEEGATSLGGNGGGIYMDSNQVNTAATIPEGQLTGSSTVNINGGSIYSNSATMGNGGGVYLQGVNALCTVTGGVIGATAKADGTPDVDRPNSAASGTVNVDGVDTTVGGNGGGIAIYGGARIKMDGGYVVNNTSNVAGGGIAVHGGYTKTVTDDNGVSTEVYYGSSMHITDGYVENNSSHIGGGISLNGAKGDSTSTVDETKYGMFFDGGHVLNNKVTPGSDGNALGGGICISASSTMKIDDGEISGNTAASDLEATTFALSQEGGGIAVCQGSTLDIYGGTIETNKAYDGGGLVVRGGSTLRMYPIYQKDADGQNVTGEDGKPVIESQGLIESNTGVRYGGGINCKGSTVVISGGKIMKNVSQQDGAGGFFDEQSTVTINEAEVSENVASNLGGGWLFRRATVMVNGGIISDNDAYQGGAIFVDGRPDGLEDDKPNVTINGGTITRNGATNDGGGIYIHHRDQYGSPYVQINGGEITRNESASSGGGIFILGEGQKDTRLTMYGGTISDNTAAARGGGINADDHATVLLSVSEDGTTRPLITRNTGARGGGIAVCYGADLTVKEGFITYNNAKGDTSGNSGYYLTDSANGVGGGIWVATGSATANASFTLDGTNMGIYGNLADFAADDVFANGNNTKLALPKCESMNLAGYGFAPEGWVEDYHKGDSNYDQGLQMVNKNGGTATENSDGTYSGVLRYRDADASQRRYSLVKSEYVAEDTGVNAADAYMCLTLGIPTALDDTVVIDYGSEVLINVWQNDLFLYADEPNDFANETVAHDGSYIGPDFSTTGLVKKDNIYFSKITTGQAPAGTKLSKSEIEKSYGVVSNVYDGTLSYSPKTMDVKGEDTFYYAVAHNGYWYYANVTVVPATSIYFEDNTTFVKYHTNADSGFVTKNGQNEVVDTLAAWTGSDSSTAQQEDRPGAAILEGLDADNIYGYDGNYTSSTTYSGGSAHKVSVYRNADGSTVNARATFTFTGTGFDIISLSSAATGLVTVSVYKGTTGIVFDDDPATDAWEPTDPLVSYMVDTYYETGDTLYQVPIIKVDMNEVEILDENYEGTGEYYGYGTYTVELYIAPSFLPSEHAYNGADFYMDAIRIYDPAGVNGSNSEAAQKAYIADGEAWPVYQELRNLFISQTDLTDDQTVSGILFIDGGEEGANSTPTLGQYKSWGPNNEIYLNGKRTDDQGNEIPAQSVAFKLDEANYAVDGVVVNRVHIGLRGLTGTGTAEIYKDGTLFKTVTLSATDMYYDISDLMNANVTIRNGGTTPISISNVKVTHEAPATFSLRRLFTANTETADVALSIYTAEQLADPALTPKYPALSFNGMVCYNVFFEAQDLGDLTEADLGLAVFSTEDTEGTVETAQDVIMGATVIDGLYMVATNGVHAKYLGDTQYFRAFAKLADGSYVYSKMVSYSAVDYATNILAKSDDVALKQLMVAMLNYGTEAQKFFGYKTDDLMNKDLTADEQALLAGIDASSLNTVGKVDASKVGAFASNGGFAKKSPAISFKGAFEINYFFTPANAVDGDMTLYFWNEDTYNSVTELTAENADKAVAMTLENGTYTASSDEIIAKYLDKTVYVAAVYESNGVTYCSGVLPYSIAAYCQNPPASVQDLATAAAIYGCTAKQYFGA